MSANDLDIGMALLHAGRWGEGIERLRAVLAREPGFAEVWSNLGFALRAAGRLAEARDALERAVSLAPHLADAWNLLGLVEQEVGRHEAAAKHFDRALALRADFAVAMMNRANSDQAMGRLEAALAGYARALQIAPGNAGIHYNLGHLHQKITGRADAAIACYREAIRVDAGLADAHLNLSHVLLSLGLFEEGWREFAWRPQRRAYAAERARRGAPYEPAAIGFAPHLHLRGEQGLGDMLFFLRYAAGAAARGSRLSFGGDARLHAMLARTGLLAQMDGGDDSPAAQGAELLVGDLPPLFRAQDPLPPPLALRAGDAQRQAIAQRLRAAGPRPWIALTWRAGERSPGLFDRLFKEAPLAPLGEALRGLQATWISVQRAPAAGEREALEGALGATVHDFSGVNGDLDDALAAMDLVDDYVGVSNTNMHLRAGVGQDARVFVPFAPEWRWGFEGRSPWFPSMRIYREAPGRDWSGAFAALTRDMRP